MQKIYPAQNTLKNSEYGRSALGIPLHYIPGPAGANTLVLAAIHGEESETTILLSRALRILTPGEAPGAHIVLCANPDGVLAGTRCNARGVDLNRNFPSGNWNAATLHSRWVLEDPPNMPLSPGSVPASEPETQALLDLIAKHNIKRIISLHSPLGCVDAPAESPYADRLSQACGLPRVTDPGYATPGSLGSWAVENNIDIITWEFPREAMEILCQKYLPVIKQVILDEV
jgi:protein MpaA